MYLENSHFPHRASTYYWLELVSIHRMTECSPLCTLEQKTPYVCIDSELIWSHAKTYHVFLKTILEKGVCTMNWGCILKSSMQSSLPCFLTFAVLLSLHRGGFRILCKGVQNFARAFRFLINYLWYVTVLPLLAAGSWEWQRSVLTTLCPDYTLSWQCPVLTILCPD